jgi:ERCC4-related helicase
MTAEESLPMFASNRSDRGETVANALNQLFGVMRGKLRETPNIAIATAFLNPAGFNLIAHELEQAPKVRLLLGAEPEPEVIRAISDSDADRDIRLADALKRHSDWMIAERDALGFTREASMQALRLVAWLKQIDSEAKPRVEVRRFTKGFLHGKAFISEDSALPAVLAGSSNFTLAGLSLNAELNLGYGAGDQVHGNLVREWFEHYWDQSEEFDLVKIYEEQWNEHSPWTVFMRMLHELYGSDLDDLAPRKLQLALTQFQSDGVARAIRLLDTLGGVLIADEVGLGKTYIAGELIARAAKENRQGVLIVCPASLKTGMWESFLKKHDFSRRVEVFSYEEIRNRMDVEHEGHEEFTRRMDDFALVVIDEAHNLRNAGAQRSSAIDRAILAGSTPKKVVLLTATPVNNSLSDLETLIRYFVRDDAQFASENIPSIKNYIKKAQDLDPERLTPEHLFTLMDQVAVRRTRKFVKDNYPGQEIDGPNGQKMTVEFPTPKVYRIDYAHDDIGDELISRVVYALDLPEETPLVARYTEKRNDPGRLILARYTSSAYLLSGEIEKFQVSNAGLLRSALLKRLESSPQALSATLTKLVNAHRGFLDALSQGRVLTGEALREWTSSEAESLDEFLEGLSETGQEDVEHASLYDTEVLKEDVASDLQLLTELQELAQEAAKFSDLKVKSLIEELSSIATGARQADARGLPSGDRRKVIIFSSFADTILDIHTKVSAAIEEARNSSLGDYKNRVAEPVMGTGLSTKLHGASGGVDQDRRTRMISEFAPETAAGSLKADGTPVSPDNFDLLFTTDVLSEGVNLQQAGRIINYDLPWNPMRIVQRHGRVDRIGSKHDTVQMGLFFPTAHLDELLRLEETLERKLAQAEAAVGAGVVLPGRSPGRQVIFADTKEQINQLYNENPELLESRGSSAALSGEEYRRRLSLEMKDPFIRHGVENLPYGSGSGFENLRVKTNGYVFCIRIGTHEKPWFRFVPVDQNWNVYIEEGKAVVNDDMLASLVAADPVAQSTARWMTPEVYDHAFDAWSVARESVLRDWSFLTDPINLKPDSPKAFRDASALVFQSGEFLSAEDRRELIGKLNAVPSKKVERAVRAALSLPGSDRERILAVKEEIEAAGIQKPEPPKPLDLVSENQVKLVTWMAVKGNIAP